MLQVHVVRFAKLTVRERLADAWRCGQADVGNRIVPDGVVLRQQLDHRILRRSDSGHDLRLGQRVRLETGEDVHDWLHLVAEWVQLFFDSALDRLFVHGGGGSANQLADGVERGVGITDSGSGGSGSGDLRGGVNASQRITLADQRRRTATGHEVGAVQSGERDSDDDRSATVPQCGAAEEERVDTLVVEHFGDDAPDTERELQVVSFVSERLNVGRIALPASGGSIGSRRFASAERADVLLEIRVRFETATDAERLGVGVLVERKRL